MNKSLLAFVLSVSVTFGADSLRGEPVDQMNVVFILADDLGWSDTTLYGTTKFYQTPNLERLAQRGMTFRRAYAASPLCSPTRASILTGLNPARSHWRAIRWGGCGRVCGRLRSARTCDCTIFE